MIRRKRSTPESPVENLTGTKKQERNRKRQSSWKSPSVITVCSLSSIALSGHLFRPWRSFSRFKSERQYPRVFQSFNDTTRGRKIRHPMSENTDLFIKKAFRRGTYADVWEVDDCRGRDWQRMNPITCNSIFEIDWRELKGLAHGGWRDVWLSNFTEPVVLKSLLFENDFTERNIDRHRRDAVALERLTRSPHVMDIYGYCGNSGLFEFAAGKSLWEVIAPDEYETNPPRNQWSKLEKLRMAAQIAKGLADVHSVDGDMATIAHTDITTEQFVNVDGVMKLGDFNRARFITSTSRGQQCPFAVSYNPGVARSPEEYAYEPETEMIDVYSLGNCFYTIWTDLDAFEEVDDSEDTRKAIMEGNRPSVPAELWKSRDIIDVTFRQVLNQTMKQEPGDRISARQAQQIFQATLARVDPHWKLTDSFVLKSERNEAQAQSLK